MHSRAKLLIYNFFFFLLSLLFFFKYVSSGHLDSNIHLKFSNTKGPFYSKRHSSLSDAFPKIGVWKNNNSITWRFLLKSVKSIKEPANKSFWSSMKKCNGKSGLLSLQIDLSV